MDIAPQTTVGTAAPAVRRRWSVSARVLLAAAGLFAVCAAAFAVIQFGAAGLVDNDAYYHTKMAMLIRQQGLTPAFIWLPYTILNQAAFYDHHMLFHVYISLFVGDGSEQNAIFGAKISSIIMPSLTFLAIWWMLRQQGVRWAALWIIVLFAASQAFLFRMSMTRAQAASLLVLVLALHCVYQRRYWPLLPLGFFYVWLYNAFPLLVAVVGAYAVAVLFTEQKIAWRPVVYACVGIGLGMVINPYFPRDFAFIFDHLGTKLGNATATAVGNEWYPYDTATLMQNSGGTLVAWLIGAFALGWRGRRMDRATLTAFILSIALGYMTFKSRRFIEYFPPFAVIFAALSVSPVLQMGAEWLHERRPRWTAAVPVVLALALLAPAGISVAQARDGMGGQGRSLGTYADASHWLRDNAAPGSMIFQTDWDDFPLLFFYNSADIYTVGLDPTFMQNHDPDLFDTWVKITRGQVAQPSELILSRFKASYIITDHDHGDFIRQAQNDPRIKQVYSDQYAVVFSVGK